MFPFFFYSYTLVVTTTYEVIAQILDNILNFVIVLEFSFYPFIIWQLLWFLFTICET
jgi:hypothetical protein